MSDQTNTDDWRRRGVRFLVDLERDNPQLRFDNPGPPGWRGAHRRRRTADERWTLIIAWTLGSLAVAALLVALFLALSA